MSEVTCRVVCTGIGFAVLAERVGQEEMSGVTCRVVCTGIGFAVC